MPTSRFVATSALALALTGAACGSLSGDTGSPSTLVTIHGTITSPPTLAAVSSLATAIIWFAALPDGTVREAADSVPVSGSFPAAFSIDLTSPPPASALVDIGAGLNGPGPLGVHGAEGLVVAYDDRNGNGQLDLVDASGSQYVDTIEGIADREVIYLDKPIPASFLATYGTFATGLDGAGARVGYNLLHSKPNYCFSDADAGAAGTCVNGWLWEPMDTAVTLALGTPSLLAPTPEVEQELMCAAGPDGNGTHSDDISCPSGSCPTFISPADFPGALPSADDPNILCDGLDSFGYTSSCTTTVGGVCQPVNTVCTQQVTVTLDPDGSSPIAPPAGWPCAAQPTPAASFLTWLAGQQHSVSGGSGGIGPATADAGAPAN